MLKGERTITLFPLYFLSTPLINTYFDIFTLGAKYLIMEASPKVLYTLYPLLRTD